MLDTRLGWNTSKMVDGKVEVESWDFSPSYFALLCELRGALAAL